MGKATPQPNSESGERGKLPSEVRGSPETILVISKDRRRPLPEKLAII